MNYYLDFKPKALKEWKKLDYALKVQFEKKLKQRLQNPKVPKDKLSGFSNIYKIKLKSADFRLIYEVKDEQIVVLVLTVGKRENNKVYKNLQKRKDEN